MCLEALVYYSLNCIIKLSILIRYQERTHYLLSHSHIRLMTWNGLYVELEWTFHFPHMDQKDWRVILSCDYQSPTLQPQHFRQSHQSYSHRGIAWDHLHPVPSLAEYTMQPGQFQLLCSDWVEKHVSLKAEVFKCKIMSRLYVDSITSWNVYDAFVFHHLLDLYFTRLKIVDGTCQISFSLSESSIRTEIPTQQSISYHFPLW